MRSLFLRIFIWFWVTLALVTAVLIMWSPFFTRSRPRLQQWERSAEAVINRHMDQVAEMVSRRGIESLQRMRRRDRHGPRLRVAAYDAEGNHLTGEEPTPAVRKLAERAGTAYEDLFERSGSLYLLARPVTGPEGKRLVLVMSHRRPPRLVDLMEPSILLPRLGSLVLVAGILCFWLARYLSSPVAALRRAVHRLRGGDLAARAGPSIGRRRDEIGQLARDFDSMAEQVQSLVSSQRRLIRDVSHELRSPLARLMVALELARQQAGEPARGALDRIEREAGRLNQMIEQVLLLSRLEGTDSSDIRRHLDLGTILDEVVADARYEAAQKGTPVELMSHERCMVEGSPVLLRSALDNVLRNAIRYTAEGTSVEVAMTCSRGHEPPVTRVSVRDHGPGVPAAELEHLFEPFFRVGDARDRGSGGTGLGLAITARAVHLHGGSLTARNHPEGGLEIEIMLPCRSVPAEESQP